MMIRVTTQPSIPSPETPCDHATAFNTVLTVLMLSCRGPRKIAKDVLDLLIACNTAADPESNREISFREWDAITTPRSETRT
jgi:hypothetical protein